MGGRLKKMQRATLESCPDWSAPYEIASRRLKAGEQSVCPRGLRNTL